MIYIDNEVPWGGPSQYGEWDNVYCQSPSTVSRSTASAWPDRGSYGLEINIDNTGGNNAAYAYKNLSAEQANLAVNFWLRLPDTPTWSTSNTLMIFATKNLTSGRYGVTLELWKHASGYALLRLYVAAGTSSASAYSTFHVFDGTGSGRGWYHINIIAEFDGSSADATLYVGGREAATVTKVGDATTNKPDRVILGSDWSSTNAVFTAYIDEVKIVEGGTDYIEPYTPTPADEYASPERTVVLHPDTPNGYEFAEYCATTLGVPMSNLCCLFAASTDETLADYATFQTQFEDELDEFFTNNTTIAANCMCFLVGYGCPGYFVSGGVTHSATSRLSNYGTAFSSQAANPLYNPGTVARLTKTGLGGKYLTTRIDTVIGSVGAAKSIVDRGATAKTIAESDKLYSDEAAYLLTLPFQRLRMISDDIVTYTADGFVWGDTGSPTIPLGDGGSRVSFADTSADSGSGLRESVPTSACPLNKAMISTYAAGLGFADTADTFDVESFFEMLRIGGTFAEAAMVATQYLDYTTVAAGSPLCTVTFQLGGYNIYRGLGSIDAIDYDTPVGCVRPAVASIDLVGAVTAEDLDHWFAIRTVSSKGVEETNTDRMCRVRVHDGQLLGPPPNDMSADHATAEAVAGGYIRLRCLYVARDQFASAVGVQVARSVMGVIDWDNLIETITINSAGSRQVVKVLGTQFADGDMVRLAIRAVTTDGQTGRHAVLPPVVIDSTSPAAVSYLEASQA